MLPKFDDLEPPLPPPKLNAWFDNLRTKDSVFSKIYDEIMDTLVTSCEEKNHRWDSIWLAGQRDVKLLAQSLTRSYSQRDPRNNCEGR